MADQEQPYRTPGADMTPSPEQPLRRYAVGEAAKLEYLKCFTFMRAHSRWKDNLLMATMMGLIIGPGQMAVQGHLFEIIRGLRRAPDPETGDHYPPLKLDRFSDIMSAGMAPFFVNLLNMVLGYIGMVVFAFIFAVPMILILFGVLEGYTYLFDSPPSIGLDIQARVIAVLAMFLGAVAAGMFARPLHLRAGLTGSFANAYSLRFMWSFVRLTWKEQLKAGLFITIVVPLLIVVSLLPCIVPVYLTLAWTGYAMAYMDYQLYEIYLARGGEPIPEQS